MQIAPHEPDRALLAACALAERADTGADAALHRARTMPASGSRLMAEIEIALALTNTRALAVERATRLSAQTPEGLQAKAALLMFVIGLGHDHTMLAASLARDVADGEGMS